MISKNDVTECFIIIAAAFPNVPIAKAQIEVYYELLSDLNIERSELRDAVIGVLKSSRFFPTAADIREEAKNNIKGRHASYFPPESWALDDANAVPMPDNVRALVRGAFKTQVASE